MSLFNLDCFGGLCRSCNRVVAKLNWHFVGAFTERPNAPVLTEFLLKTRYFGRSVNAPTVLNYKLRTTLWKLKIKCPVLTAFGVLII